MAAHHNMKSSQSPSGRSIQQAPSRDLQQWHDSTTKSAIPQRVTTYSVIYALLNCFHVICFLGKSSIHCCIQDQGYIQNHFPQVNARGSDFSEIVPPWPTRIQTERQRLGHTGVGALGSDGEEPGPARDPGSGGDGGGLVNSEQTQELHSLGVEPTTDLEANNDKAAGSGKLWLRLMPFSALGSNKSAAGIDITRGWDEVIVAEKGTEHGEALA